MSPRRRDRPPGPTEAARLADELRTQILSGELAAGQPLREQALAATTGLSRHTVRTALASLTTERLVVQEPYRGTRVTSFTDADVQALQQLRCALEAEAVRLTRERWGPTWPDDITKLVHEMLTELEQIGKAQPGDWTAIATAHAAVHRAIVATAANPRLDEAYARLDSEMLLLLVNLRPTYSAHDVVADHRTYLDQIQADGENAVRAHLDHGTRQIWPRSARHLDDPDASTIKH